MLGPACRKLPPAFSYFPSDLSILATAPSVSPSDLSVFPSADSIFTTAPRILPSAFSILASAFSVFRPASSVLRSASSKLPSASIPSTAWVRGLANSQCQAHLHFTQSSRTIKKCKRACHFSPRLFMRYLKKKQNFPSLLLKFKQQPHIPTGVTRSSVFQRQFSTNFNRTRQKITSL